jgi:hypothetical protein
MRQQLRITSKRSRKRGITALAAAVITIAALAGCTQGAQGGAGVENGISSAISTHYEVVQPPYEPSGQSVYRENLTDAEADQVLGLNTTSFFFQMGSRAPFFWCPSHGGAVPDTAQLTNPDYVEPDPNASQGSVTIGNMDPNGVYSPTSSSGTYVLCVDSSGAEYLVYSEPDVVQISAPAVWSYTADNGLGGIQVTGTPVMPVCTAEEVSGKAQTVCTAPSTAPPGPTVSTVPTIHPATLPAAPKSTVTKAA